MLALSLLFKPFNYWIFPGIGTALIVTFFGCFGESLLVIIAEPPPRCEEASQHETGEL